MRDRKPKIHYYNRRLVQCGFVWTRCGKWLSINVATRKPEEVTCRTCKLILDIPEGELDRLG
jgi:hypothetical protein